MGDMSQTDPSVSFGRPMRDAHFSFAKSYTPLNHGSYGVSPISVRAFQRHLQDEAEARPDPFIRGRLPQLLDLSRVAVAPLLGVPTNEVVFVPNATTAVNTVLRNLQYDENDVILYFSTIYDACEKTIKYVCESTTAKSFCVPLEYPIEDEEIDQQFLKAVDKLKREGRRVKIAMFDAVSSFPGVRVPWELLVGRCKQLQILSLIDGAHGIGHIDLTHMGKVGPDFFTSNCYKWLYTPRGCAVFHVPARNQHLIRSTLPISHGFRPLSDISTDEQRNHFVDLFSFVATTDTSPYMCVPEALNFRENVCGGEEEVRSYCKKIARQGGQMVAEILGTSVMNNDMGTLGDCCFANVKLPLTFSPQTAIADTERLAQLPLAGPGEQHKFDPAEALEIGRWMMKIVSEEYDSHVPVGYHAGNMWARLSGQIYLERGDFEFAGTLLRDLCKRVEQGEYRDPVT